MIKFNFSSIGDNLEDLLDIKRDVEKKMLEDGVITEKLKLDEFISKVVRDTVIYFSCNVTIPFTIIHGKEDDYLIYTDNDKQDAYVENMYNRLKEVDFDTTKLRQLELLNTFDLQFDKETFFIQHGTYYK